ncbi:MAG TPA: exodeoxyribonuclease VII small subunit [Thermoanaerobaculia bacterium]|nr:exodeoxyribonuclease VII small subunit [Thermoanaerobaculia bacterium]
MRKANQEEAVEPAREPTFTETMRELEEILARIEGEEIDIDELATELRRATALLELARGKIRKAELEVTQIVQSLEKGDAGEEA